MARIVILGAGGFGLALSFVCAKEHETAVWSAFPDEIEQLKINGGNEKLLPGVKLNENILLTSDIACLENADAVIFAVPSFALRDVAKIAASKINKSAVIINVSKGLESGSYKRLSEVLKEELSGNSVVALSGPSHAEEVARGIPTTLVTSSHDMSAAEYVQDLLMNDRFRIYTNGDIIGVEIGAAVKNVIALCAGISDGMGMGDNTKAALITRGLSEIAHLGMNLGAKSETFAGLTGIGDLIVTCTSIHSRNNRAGFLIGKGTKADEAVSQVGTVEGYYAAKTVYELSVKHGVEMPITEQCYNICYEYKDVRQSLYDLMSRPKKHETEKKWLD